MTTIDKLKAAIEGELDRAITDEQAETILAYISEWQPIEFAPKDGTEILGYRDDCGVMLMKWTSVDEFLSDKEMENLDEETIFSKDWFCADFIGGCRLEGEEIPALWMPLPKQP